MGLEAERNIVDEALNLLEQKAEDYNTNIARDAYFPHGLISYHQMLHTKVLRIQSLIQKKGQPNFEGIEDSLQDLLNYTIMALVYVKRTHPRARTDNS